MTSAQPPHAPRPRGRFITFEGGEGAGKSTQVKRLADRLREIGIIPVLTREPGGSPGAEALRHVLLSGAAEALGHDAEAMLFAAARADHVQSLIQPALERGDWVICDRFIDSTRVYQSISGTVPPRFVAALEAISIGEVKPDLTILLDVPVEEGLRRAAQRRGTGDIDRFEKDSLTLHDQRRSGFLSLARAEPTRFAAIDAGKDQNTVAEAIWYVVKRRLVE